MFVMTENASHGNIRNTRVNMDAGRTSAVPREQPAKRRVYLERVDEQSLLPNGKMPSAVSRKTGQHH
jgi:hypothetical protein